MRGKSLVLIALVAAQSLAPVTVQANMANPSDPGDVIGEPAGALAGLAIEHETLGIDLRPLAAGAPAEISATYQIRNDGEHKTVDLVFVATSLSAAGSAGGAASVLLDGTAVPFQANGAAPADWPPPSTTPRFDRGTLPFHAINRGQLLFSLELAPGPHTIAVRYRAEASRYSGDSPTVYWQLGYVLSPARQWASFGTLEVSVDVPAGWRAASEPALQRSGDQLTGTFAGVPADALALTAQMPPPGPGVPVPLIGLLLIFIGAFIFGWLAGGAVGARGRNVLWVLPLAVTYGAAAFVAMVFFAAIGEGARTGGVPASQVAWTYGYGGGLILLILSPVVGVTAGAAFQVCAWISATRARQKRSRPPQMTPSR